MENNFKVKLLVASVVMGLSLSVFAETGESTMGETGSTTSTPATDLTTIAAIAYTPTSGTFTAPDIAAFETAKDALQKALEAAQAGTTDGLAQALQDYLNHGAKVAAAKALSDRANDRKTVYQTIAVTTSTSIFGGGYLALSVMPVTPSAVTSPPAPDPDFAKLANPFNVQVSGAAPGENTLYGKHQAALKEYSKAIKDLYEKTKAAVDKMSPSKDSSGTSANQADAALTKVKNIGTILAMGLGIEKTQQALELMDTIGKESQDAFIKEVKALTNGVAATENTSASTQAEKRSNLAFLLAQYDSAFGAIRNTSDFDNLKKATDAMEKLITAAKDSELVGTEKSTAFETAFRAFKTVVEGLTKDETGALAVFKKAVTTFKATGTDDNEINTLAERLENDSVSVQNKIAAIEAFMEKHFKTAVDLVLADTDDTAKTEREAVKKLIDGDTTTNQKSFAQIQSEWKSSKEELENSTARLLGDLKEFNDQRLAYENSLDNLKAVENEKNALVGRFPELKTLDDASVSLETQRKAALAATDALINDLFGMSPKATEAPAALAALSKAYADAVAKEGATSTDRANALNALIGGLKGLAYGVGEAPSPLVSVALAKLQLTKADPNNDLNALSTPVGVAKKNLDDTKTAYENAAKAYVEAKAAQQAAQALPTTDAERAAKVADAEAALKKAELILQQAGQTKALDTSTSVAQTTPGTTTNLFDEQGNPKSFDDYVKALGDTTKLAAQFDLEAAQKNYTTAIDNLISARTLAAQTINVLSSVLPYSSAADQGKAAKNFQDLAGQFSAPLSSLQDQIADPEITTKTRYLGGLSPNELTTLDSNGDLRTLSTHSAGSTSNPFIFTGADIYTGIATAPINTTVLNIEAPTVADTLNNGTITVKDASVFASTYGEAKMENSRTLALTGEALANITPSSGAAVVLGGELYSGRAVVDANNPLQNISGITAAPITGRINLENLVINNTVSNTGLTKAADGVNVTATGLLIGTNVTTPTLDQANGTFGRVNVPTPSATPNINLTNVNIVVSVDNSLNTIAATDGATTPATAGANAISISGNGNHIAINGNGSTVISAEAKQKEGQGTANAILFSGTNNRVDVTGANLTGDISDTNTAPNSGVNTVNLTGSTLTGDAQSTHTPTGRNFLDLNLNGSIWTGSSYHSPDVSLKNSTWNVRNAPDGNGSSVNRLRLLDGNNFIDLVEHIGRGDISGRGQGVDRASNLHVEQFVSAEKDALTTIRVGAYTATPTLRQSRFGFAGNYSYGTFTVADRIVGADANTPARLRFVTQNGGGEPAVVDNRLASGLAATEPFSFASWKTVSTGGVRSNVELVNSVTEQGVWQYQAVQQADATSDLTNVYFANNGKLSNSAATAASLAAAPVNIASLESDALANHLSSLRHSDGSGVWIAYFGGSNKNTLKNGPQYTLKSNGVMLGVDTSFASDQWLAGVAFSSAKSDLSLMSSTGDVNSYGAQFYLSRRYDNGVFVDGNAQFGHFSNKASARMLDGVLARGDYATNGYGLGVKLGYAYQNMGFYAEPYIRATGRAFSGGAYNLDNGMNVHNTDYKSLLGEIGADLGYNLVLNNSTVKPYLHLAVLNEFANGNRVEVNNISLDNSINGAAFQVGVGAQVKLMKNLGGYVAYDYTTGGDIKRPWQATVGINYTW